MKILVNFSIFKFKTTKFLTYIDFDFFTNAVNILISAKILKVIIFTFKVLLGFESGYIPPNIHFRTPRAVECFLKKRLVVVDEKRLWPKKTDIIAGWYALNQI